MTTLSQALYLIYWEGATTKRTLKRVEAPDV